MENKNNENVNEELLKSENSLETVNEEVTKSDSVENGNEKPLENNNEKIVYAEPIKENKKIKNKPVSLVGILYALFLAFVMLLVTSIFNVNSIIAMVLIFAFFVYVMMRSTVRVENQSASIKLFYGIMHMIFVGIGGYFIMLILLIGACFGMLS